MGIKGLNRVIERFSPSANQTKSFSYFSGSTIGVDISIYLHKFKHIYSSAEVFHLLGLFEQVSFLLKHGILPVYVFDGTPPKQKDRTLQIRARAKQKTRTKINVLLSEIEKSSDINESDTHRTLLTKLEKLKKYASGLKKSTYAECKELLTVLGIPYVQALGEAEAACGALTKLGLIDFTMTEDTDAFLFGCGSVLRKADIKGGTITKTNFEDALKGIGFSHDQFIDFCILSGCDYSSTLPRIGPITAHNLVKKHGTIEKILETLHLTKDLIPKDFDFIAARELFKEPPSAHINTSTVLGPFKLKPFDENSLKSLVRSFNLPKWVESSWRIQYAWTRKMFLLTSQPGEQTMTPWEVWGRSDPKSSYCTSRIPDGFRSLPSYNARPRSKKIVVS